VDQWARLSDHGAGFFRCPRRSSGEIKRRTPLCGASEALAAATSAQAALPDWAARTVAERAALLLALADALAGYGEHFAALISEESGKDAALAAAEVGDALSLLRGAAPGAASDTGSTGSAANAVVAIVSDDSAPLLGPLRHAVPALLAVRRSSSSRARKRHQPLSHWPN
jgi:acyl-CoA reductase-like NAD-dependent aldehyde dehydrogenase